MTKKLLSSVAFLSIFLNVPTVNSAEISERGYSLVEIDKEMAETTNALVITKSVKDEEGHFVEKFYEVKLFGQSDNTKWQEIPESEKDTEIANSAVVAIKNADGKVKYYRYGYEAGRQVYTAQQKNLSGDVDADFVGKEPQKGGVGGAIYNRSTISSITGDFINNTVEPGSWESYGAIYNEGKIGSIVGDFVGNYLRADSSYYAMGAAISNHGAYGGRMDDVRGNFIGNYAVGQNVYGGAIASIQSKMGNITGDFIGNYAQGRDEVVGGGIANVGSEIGQISGDFISNSASSSANIAVGGAIYNDGSIQAIVNSNFINNSVSGNDDSAGGAIYSVADLNIVADAKESLFSGNTVNGVSNAIYVGEADLNLSAVQDGVITFDDGIDGTSYNINVDGDGSGVVRFNNEVKNVSNLTMTDDSIIHLGLNADIHVQNMSVSDNDQSAKRGASAPIITVDVNVDKVTNEVDAGAIHVSEDVSGDYHVLVNSLNSDVLDNSDDANVPFLFAPNDNKDTVSNFQVARVMGSPFMWNAANNYKGEEEGSTWYLTLGNVKNPDYDGEIPEPDDNKKPDDDLSNVVLTPEVGAYVSVPTIVVEQNKNVARHIAQGLANEKSALCYEESCGLAEVVPHKRAWAHVAGDNATVKAPFDVDADVYSFTGGADFYRDYEQRAGVFGVYSRGKYDLSGKGKYVLSGGSDIKVNSYLGGLYYKYNQQDWNFLSTMYAGKQSLDVNADDGFASASTDAMQYGVSAELAKRIMLNEALSVEPSVAVRYMAADIDNINDSVRKEAHFDLLHYLEAELGLKLEYLFCDDGLTNRLYVKPSVIRTYTNGDDVQVSGIKNGFDAYKNQTLGRMEIGGEFGFSSNLSGYANGGYTFGNKYDAYDLNIGLQYAF